MTDKFKVGKTSKENYKKYLKKADEFFEIMQISLPILTLESAYDTHAMPYVSLDHLRTSR